MSQTHGRVRQRNKSKNRGPKTNLIKLQRQGFSLFCTVDSNPNDPQFDIEQFFGALGENKGIGHAVVRERFKMDGTFQVEGRTDLNRRASPL